jgi:hypothetical protein
MAAFEKIKRHFLVFGLDEPFDIFRIIMDVHVDFKPKNELELQEKTLKIIHELLNTGYFEIVDWTPSPSEPKPWALSIDQCVLKVKSLWDKYGLDWGLSSTQPEMWIYFALTKNGEKKANEYIQLAISLIEQAILKQKVLSIVDIMNIVAEVFKTKDVEEMAYETIDLVYTVLLDHLMEIGVMKNGIFYPIPCNAYDFRKKLEDDLKDLNQMPKPEDFPLFQNTPTANEAIEKWRNNGGKLWEDYLYKQNTQEKKV